MLYVKPIGEMLRGVDFDGSRFSKTSFYDHVFFVPLCVPMQHVHFTFGFRIRKGGWNYAPGIEAELSEAIEQEAIPFLSRIKTYGDAADDLRTRMGESGNPHVHEAIAYCSVMAGDHRHAREAMARALVNAHQRNIPWQNDLAHRVEAVGELLDRSPEAAKERLRWWEDETKRNLGLEGL
jgi:hypothetical protein